MQYTGSIESSDDNTGHTTNKSQIHKKSNQHISSGDDKKKNLET